MASSRRPREASPERRVAFLRSFRVAIYALSPGRLGSMIPLVACDLISSDGAVFAQWGVPTIEDMDRVADALREAAAKARRPVIYIARVPAQAPPPDAKVRSHLDSLMPEIVEKCSAYHVVMEGDGFFAAMKRAVLLGIFQVRWRRGVFFVHSSIAELLREIAATDRETVSSVLDSAQRAGLLPSHS